MAAEPAVHVTPIPVEPAPAEVAGGESRPGETKGPDDTSTAAISVINANRG